MTGDFWVGVIFGFMVGGTLGAMAMALFAASGNDYGYVQITPDANADEDPETTSLREQLAQTRHHLSVCQATAEQQRQRADTYYDLYCEGAKANAALRKRAL